MNRSAMPKTAYQQFVERNSQYLRPEPMGDLAEATRLASDIRAVEGRERQSREAELRELLAAVNARLIAVGWAPVEV